VAANQTTWTRRWPGSNHAFPTSPTAFGASHELHSGVLEHAGLVAALKQHCREFAQHHGLDVSFSADGDGGSLDPDVALCLYRVAQEALSNTARHARARTAQVRLALISGRAGAPKHRRTRAVREGQRHHRIAAGARHEGAGLDPHFDARGADRVGAHRRESMNSAAEEACSAPPS
jgi:two-component sensor histidine kinase